MCTQFVELEMDLEENLPKTLPLIEAELAKVQTLRWAVTAVSKDTVKIEAVILQAAAH